MPPIGSTWSLNTWLDTAWAEFTWADALPPVTGGENVGLMNGVPLAIAQTTAYALPGRSVKIQSTVAIEVSVDNTTWTALTGADTIGAESAAMFVRCTTSTTCVVVCKVI